MLDFNDPHQEKTLRRLQTRCERDTYRLGFWTGAMLASGVTTVIFTILIHYLFKP